jgi:hypothetical protein
MTITDNRNITNLMLANGTGNLIVDTALTVHDLTEGQVAFAKPGGAIVANTSIAALGDFIYAIYEGGKLWLSTVINYNDIDSANGVVYSAPAQKISYVGYNGNATTHIEETDSTNFVLNVQIITEGETHAKQDYIKFGAYKSGTSASEYQIATGVTSNLITNFSREERELIAFEIICDEDGTALGTSVDTLAFVKGSKYFTADDIDDATGAGSALAVGDFLKYLQEIL